MGKYTIFSDVSKTIMDMLKAELVPEPMSSAEHIGICYPNERGNFTVGIHAYDFNEIKEMGTLPHQVLPGGYTRSAPVSYQLSYFISVSSKAEEAVKAIEESRIIGRILQILNDCKNLPTKYMPEALRSTGEVIGLNMISLELEEKIKIWSMYNEPYKQSVFFSVGPVPIESAVITPPAKRVKKLVVDDKQAVEE